MGNLRQGEEIRTFIELTVADHPLDIAACTAEQFGISRQAVERHLAQLEKEGTLRSVKDGRRRRWTPATHRFRWALRGLDEARVFADEIAPRLVGIRDNVVRIVHHGFTEMVNNAIDHSGAESVEVQLSIRRGSVEVWVGDHGIGAFRNIARYLDLRDERDAVLELAKGRLTTMPERHAGEGIFFTSRAMDTFVIWSNKLCLQRVREHVQTMARSMPPDVSTEGTLVLMKIATDSDRTLKAVFDEYCPDVDGDFAFTRTRLDVRLCAYDGSSVVARSQAKRLMSRVETFRTVSLNFAGVREIGQGFADEVFRVWVREHPDVAVSYENASPDVEQMIRHVQAGSGNSPAGSAPVDA